jgi:hypothetical protein
MAVGAVENGCPALIAQPAGIIEDEKVWWSAPGLIEELVALVMGGYERSPWGGVEVGGVLFGTKEPDGLYIHSYRSLEIEHRHGPSFDLSDRDVNGLSRLVADTKEDLDLKRLIPVGWYHSVSHREFCLTAQDIALHDRFFPEPWHVALVLKRSQKDPVVIGLFFRQHDGSIATQSGYAYTLNDLRSRQSIAQSSESAVCQLRALDSALSGRPHSPTPETLNRMGSIPNDLMGRLRFEQRVRLSRGYHPADLT